MAIVSSAGTVAFAFTVPVSGATMVISSPDIATGTAYTVYGGGTASGDDLFHGLYLGSLAWSGGSALTRFTVSSGVTKLGGVYF